MKIIVFLFVFSLASIAHAEIKTQKEADEFIKKYCISLVSELEKAVKKQKSLAESKDWENFSKANAWIVGISEIYSKICK